MDAELAIDEVGSGHAGHNAKPVPSRLSGRASGSLGAIPSAKRQGCAGAAARFCRRFAVFGLLIPVPADGPLLAWDTL
jgi:hypothetical protein